MSEYPLKYSKVSNVRIRIFRIIRAKSTVVRSKFSTTRWVDGIYHFIRIFLKCCCLCNEPNTLHPGATDRPRPLYPLPTNPPLEGLATALILRRKYKKNVIHPPHRVPSLVHPTLFALVWLIGFGMFGFCFVLFCFVLCRFLTKFRIPTWQNLILSMSKSRI